MFGYFSLIEMALRDQCHEYGIKSPKNIYTKSVRNHTATSLMALLSHGAEISKGII